MGSQHIPKIEWGDPAGAAHPNTLEFGDPLAGAIAHVDPAPGSVTAETRSGESDAWVTGERPILRGVVEYIRSSDYAGPYGTKTGWDGATGWDAFFAWARQGYAFDFFPDATVGTSIESLLVEPFQGPPTRSDAGELSVSLVIRAVNPADRYTGYTRA